jgi:hypothetical protein
MKPLLTDLLLLLRTAGEYGEIEGLLLSRLRLAGNRELTLPELKIAMLMLADRCWVARIESPLSGKRYRITVLGLSILAEEGLAST